MTRRIKSAGSGAHLTASSRRTRTDRIVKTFRSRGTHSYGANGTRLAASSATKICGFHTAVISADGATAIPSRLAERLQPQLEIGQTRLPCLATAALHFQICDPSIEVADITLKCDTANSSYIRYADRHIRHTFSIQSSFQTIPRHGRLHLLLLLRFHTTCNLQIIDVMSSKRTNN